MGVDDFAWRKGQTYGTIIVDLERHRPRDLLADRSAPALAAWLRQQPPVATICSDRSTEYACGIADGAPNATAVADRWQPPEESTRGLGTASRSPSAELRGVTLPIRQREPVGGSTAGAETKACTRRPAPRSLREQAIQQGRRAQREARFVEARALFDQGLSLQAVADRLGLQRATVTRSVRAAAFPERASRPKRPGILAPYAGYLQQRWEAGCRSGLERLQEIRAQGFTGSRKSVAWWVRERRETPTPTKYLPALAPILAPTEIPPPARRPSARQLSWLLVRETERLWPASR